MIMEDTKSYTSLDVWKKSRLLTSSIYSLTKKFPKDELYGLTNQIRRCAISIPSNIAEGSGRRTARDFSNFIDISLSSSNELISDLIVCLKLCYLKNDDVNTIIAKIESWQNMTFSFQENQLKN
jgi:four helix bundle protein